MKKLDPRLVLIINNSFLIIYSHFYFSIHKELKLIVLTLGTALLTELILVKIVRDSFDYYDRFLSAAASGLSVIILLRSDELWFLPMVSFIAILSKYIFHIVRLRHFFNPTNFSIVLFLSFFSKYVIFDPDALEKTWYLSLEVFLVGSFLIYWVGRWIVPFSYIIAAIVISGVIHLFTGIKLYQLFGPEIGAGGMVFLFFMTCDPKTTPSKKLEQVFFGAFMAITAITLRMNEMLGAHFVALFVTCWVYSLFRERGHFFKKTSGNLVY